jgi:hypothetical protein
MMDAATGPARNPLAGMIDLLEQEYAAQRAAAGAALLRIADA